MSTAADTNATPPTQGLPAFLSGIGALTPALGDVGAIAKVIDDGELIYRQAHAEGVINTPYAKLKANNYTYQRIVDNPNEAVANAQLGDFVNGLLTDAGIPVGHVGGKFRRVPMEYFDALVSALEQYVCLRDQDNSAKVSNAVK